MIEERVSYGAVVFDDEERPIGGWASAEGTQAFRVRGTGDLSTDVVWWTNMNYGMFYRFGGLDQPKLRRSDYLRPDMKQLMSELGLTPSRMAPARIAEIVGELFGRTMRLATRHYGIERPRADTLAEDLYEILLRWDRPITPDIDEALQQTRQPWTTCEVAPPAQAQMVTFRRPRLRHAMEVLETPLPGDQWEFIDGADMPAEHQRVEWLIKQSRPVLAKIAILRVEPDVAPIIGFGSGVKGKRGWMTHPELLCLSKFAHIRVDAAFLADGYRGYEVNQPLYTGEVIGPLSHSLGILAEGYWSALSIPRPYKKGERVRLMSPRAGWLLASDRLYSMMPALMLHGSGFAVRGYGRGAVVLALQRGALAEARACATSAGLLPPLRMPEEISMREALST